MSGFRDSEICRSILESLPTGVFVLDLDKKIAYWSNGAEQITGYLRHEVVGRSCEENILDHCDQKKEATCGASCPLGMAIHNGRPVETVGWLHHKAGHQVTVRMRAVPVRNVYGLIVGVAGSFEEQRPTESVDHHEDGLKAAGCVDETTGAASQTIMQSYLRETLARFAELKVPFGILSIRLEGLDHFRADSGQEAAATFLQTVARTLESALWRTDLVGRWRDDQFLVILNGCSEEALYAVRERIRRMLANDDIQWWGEKRSLPVIIGHASAQAQDTIDSLLARAQRSVNDGATKQSRLAEGACASGGAGS
jgi:diguanylate cyclase (GGDEF)-like protein/PAS domain S-box-containing protein